MRRRPRAAPGRRVGAPLFLLTGASLLLVPATLPAQGPPNAPVDLEAEVSSEEVRLTWDTDDSGNRLPATFFRVYRDGEHVGSSGDDEFTDSDVQVGEDYSYRVSGVDFLGREGDESDPLDVTVPDDLVPDRPRNVVAEAVSSSRIDLDWDPVCTDPDDDDDDDDEEDGDDDDCRPADRYYVYRDGGVSPIDSVSSPGYGDTGLASFTLYS
ncbi:MAG: hypothetical protein ACODAA_05470, partial [Gemmatimonadota bacterium]